MRRARMWPFKRAPKELTVPQIEFIGEQDGPPERDLKTALANIFKSDGRVSKAYLAIARYSDGAVNVVLCLRVVAGSEEEVVGKVNRVFGEMFSRQMHVDILFLDSVQEASVAKVCKSFI